MLTLLQQGFAAYPPWQRLLPRTLAVQNGHHFTTESFHYYKELLEVSQHWPKTYKSKRDGRCSTIFIFAIKPVFSPLLKWM